MRGKRAGRDEERGKGRIAARRGRSWAEGRKKRASLGRRDERRNEWVVDVRGEEGGTGCMPEGETREPPPGWRGGKG